jgi:hypothetical protein
MPTNDNKVKEDNNVDNRYLLPFCSKPRETVKTLISADTVSNANSKFNEQPETRNWWTDELNSLEIKIGKSNAHNNRKEALSRQWLEDLTDDIKQTFIRNHKIWYGE